MGRQFIWNLRSLALDFNKVHSKGKLFIVQEPILIMISKSPDLSKNIVGQLGFNKFISSYTAWKKFSTQLLSINITIPVTFPFCCSRLLKTSSYFALSLKL
jgi:hypothetical protein